MKNKTLLIVIIGLIVLAVIIGFMLFNFNKNPEPYKNPVRLTEDKLITNQTFIDMIVNDKISPLGNNLSMIVFRDDGKNGIRDGFYDLAYFSCTSNEHQGWIYHTGGIAGIRELYGPYGWCLI